MLSNQDSLDETMWNAKKQSSISNQQVRDASQIALRLICNQNPYYFRCNNDADFQQGVHVGHVRKPPKYKLARLYHNGKMALISIGALCLFLPEEGVCTSA